MARGQTSCQPPWIYSLWAINDALDLPRLRRQMDAMKADGFDGVVWHPRFYPGVPPYLSAEYFDILSQVILHARDTGLRFWLYDENGWPSGVAGGELIRRYPAEAASLLTLHEGEAGDAWHGFRENGRAWHLRLVQTREIDYFNPEACGHFLEIVHASHRDRLAPEAWAHVEAIFTDEPEFGLGVNESLISPHGAIPWSPVLPALYEKQFGRDIRRDLPGVFFSSPDGSHEAVRIRFWEFMTDRLGLGYFAPYQAWCHREGKLFTGHLKGDEHPLFQVMMNGSCHQAFQHFDMPGIDPLERFPFCDYYVREVAAAAHQFGRGRAMAEVAGGAGWGCSPGDLERFLLWLGNHGCTDLVIHLNQYRLHSHAICDWPPSSPGGLTWREVYPEVLRRVRRKTDAEVVSGADTLVIAPYRAIMAGYEPWSLKQSNIHNCMVYPDTAAGRVNREFLALVDRLPLRHAAHHFADERSLEQHGCVVGSKLWLGHHAYSTVILDNECRFGPEGKRLLSDFVAGGGRQLLADAIPDEAVACGTIPRACENIVLVWESADSPPNEFLLEPACKAGTDWWQAEFEIGEPIKAALAVDFADGITDAECDGFPLAPHGFEEGTRCELPAGIGTEGRHVIRFKLPNPPRSRVFAWLCGDFHVLSQSPWNPGPQGTNVTAGPWRILSPCVVPPDAERTANGWPFSRAGVTFTGSLHFSREMEAGESLAFYGAAADAARLSLDGRDLGWSWEPDWNFAVRAPLKAGVHKVEMRILPSTYNRYGPHHHIDGDLKITSPLQFSGVKNFADRPDAPESTHDALWRVKPLQAPQRASIAKTQ